MAKKRKLRPSEPEVTKAPEQPPPQPAPPPQLKPEPVVEIDHRPNPILQQTLESAMDEEESEEEEDEEEEEEEEEEAEDDSETPGQNGGVPAEEEDDEPVEKLLEPFTREQLLVLVRKAVEKHPELASNIRSIADADPAHRKIFVHGLGWDTTAETLISEFGKYGEIEDCKAVTDRVSGKSKGYAFILFKRRSGARAALKEPQKRIGNRTTSSQLASAGPVPAPSPMGPAGSSAAAAQPVSEYTQRKIFVSNVSAETEPAKLLEFFRQFGEVEEGPLGLDRMTGKPKGFALFVYKTLEGAKKALEEPHKILDGLTLHCQKAIDGPKGQNKAYQQQQQQQQQQQHHHHHHQQQQFHGRKDKNKYPPAPGHMMAPSAQPPVPVGYNPGAPPMNPALGQALTAFLATQGGLGIGNLLGGLGAAPVNPQGPPPAGYVAQPGGGYAAQPGMQGGYQNPPMGQTGARPHHPGPGAPYMGH